MSSIDAESSQNMLDGQTLDLTQNAPVEPPAPAPEGPDVPPVGGQVSDPVVAGVEEFAIINSVKLRKFTKYPKAVFLDRTYGDTSFNATHHAVFESVGAGLFDLVIDLGVLDLPRHAYTGVGGDAIFQGLVNVIADLAYMPPICAHSVLKHGEYGSVLDNLYNRFETWSVVGKFIGDSTNYSQESWVARRVLDANFSGIVNVALGIAPPPPAVPGVAAPAIARALSAFYPVIGRGRRFELSSCSELEFEWIIGCHENYQNLTVLAERVYGALQNYYTLAAPISYGISIGNPGVGTDISQVFENPYLTLDPPAGGAGAYSIRVNDLANAYTYWAVTYGAKGVGVAEYSRMCASFATVIPLYNAYFTTASALKTAITSSLSKSRLPSFQDAFIAYLTTGDFHAFFDLISVYPFVNNNVFVRIATNAAYDAPALLCYILLTFFIDRTRIVDYANFEMEVGQIVDPSLQAFCALRPGASYQGDKVSFTLAGGATYIPAYSHTFNTRGRLTGFDALVTAIGAFTMRAADPSLDDAFMARMLLSIKTTWKIPMLRSFIEKVLHAATVFGEELCASCDTNVVNGNGGGVLQTISASFSVLEINVSSVLAGLCLCNVTREARDSGVNVNAARDEGKLLALATVDIKTRNLRHMCELRSTYHYATYSAFAYQQFLRVIQPVDRNVIQNKEAVASRLAVRLASKYFDASYSRVTFDGKVIGTTIENEDMAFYFSDHVYGVLNAIAGAPANPNWFRLNTINTPMVAPVNYNLGYGYTRYGGDRLVSSGVCPQLFLTKLSNCCFRRVVDADGASVFALCLNSQPVDEDGDDIPGGVGERYDDVDDIDIGYVMPTNRRRLFEQTDLVGFLTPYMSAGDSYVSEVCNICNGGDIVRIKGKTTWTAARSSFATSLDVTQMVALDTLLTNLQINLDNSPDLQKSGKIKTNRLVLEQVMCADERGDVQSKIPNVSFMFVDAPHDLASRTFADLLRAFIQVKRDVIVAVPSYPTVKAIFSTSEADNALRMRPTVFEKLAPDSMATYGIRDCSDISRRAVCAKEFVAGIQEGVKQLSSILSASTGLIDTEAADRVPQVVGKLTA